MNLKAIRWENIDIRKQRLTKEQFAEVVTILEQRLETASPLHQKMIAKALKQARHMANCTPKLVGRGDRKAMKQADRTKLPTRNAEGTGNPIQTKAFESFKSSSVFKGIVRG